MKALVFDTETTGLPDFSLPADHESQPRVAQLAAVLFDGDQEIASLDTMLLPDGWSDKARADLDRLAHLHGLDCVKIEEGGRPLKDVLAEFGALMDGAEVMVAYGIQFDLKLMRGEWRRAGLPDRYQKLPNFCVMQAVTPLCKLPPTERMVAAGRNGPKTPKLGEAVKILLGRDLEGAHRAINDVRATAELYRWLKAREAQAA
jgi:DNA polymerase-3 subunit epsilon